MTLNLNDLEQRNGRYFALFQRIRLLPGALRKRSRSLSHLLMSSCRLSRAFCSRVGARCSINRHSLRWRTRASGVNLAMVWQPFKAHWHRQNLGRIRYRFVSCTVPGLQIYWLKVNRELWMQVSNTYKSVST